mgnify:CR=1 FL=1
MSKYINGLEIDNDHLARKVVTEDEQVRYYVHFRGAPDVQQVNRQNTIIYDGGSVDGW